MDKKNKTKLFAKGASTNETHKYQRFCEHTSDIEFRIFSFF